MITKDFQAISTQDIHEPPHRALSRAPATRNLTLIVLGCAAAAVVLAVLWVLYRIG